jgi:hypothetical protein
MIDGGSVKKSLNEEFGEGAGTPVKGGSEAKETASPAAAAAAAATTTTTTATATATAAEAPPLPQEVLASLLSCYRKLAGADTGDGSHSRRQAQYISARAVAETMRGLEMTAFELDGREADVMGKMRRRNNAG